MNIPISLVSTVLNDRQGAELLLADLVAQTRHPDEFVIVDGGSTDGTYEFLCEQSHQVPFTLNVISKPGANVSHGRNVAIEQAKHNIILTTDFGCRLDTHWVEKLAQPFDADPAIEIVTGTWKIHERDIVTPAQWAEWALASGQLELVATPTCLASTRSLAFKKQVWLDFGKYPEDLSLAGDDAIFSLWMVSAQRKIAAAPEAICYWHRFPQLKSYFKEARRNFRGAGEAIFFLKYGVKAGVLLALELTSIIALLSLPLLLWLGMSLWIAGVIAGISLLIWLRRLLRWGRAIALLSRSGKAAYWRWVIAMEMGIRLNAVYGYWRGFVHGFKHCRACRSQMAQLGVARW